MPISYPSTVRQSPARIGSALLALALFLGMSVVVESRLDAIQALITDSVGGMVTYTLCMMLLVAIPFASSMALVPVASALWGWPLAGLLTLGAWLISSAILFLMLRRYGRSAVLQVVPPSTTRRIMRFLEATGTPGMIIIRAALTSDLSVYMLAFFTRISVGRFLTVSLVGLAVPAFAAAYVGGLSLEWKLGVLAAGSVFFGLYLLAKWRVAKQASMPLPPRRTMVAS